LELLGYPEEEVEGLAANGIVGLPSG